MMTVSEMHRAVRLGLDKSTSLVLPAFEPEELDFWLNEAQLQLVKQKAFGNNYRGEAFEDSVKRIEDLSSLLKQSGAVSLINHTLYDNVKVANLNSILDYMFFVDASIIYDGSKDDMSIGTKIIKHADIKNLIQTDFNIPVIKMPFIYFYDNKIGIIHDPYMDSVKAIHITYIKKPLILTSGALSAGETNVSELSEQLHPEIVALTVDMLLENIESPRQDRHSTQLNKKE